MSVTYTEIMNSEATALGEDGHAYLLGWIATALDQDEMSPQVLTEGIAAAGEWEREAAELQDEIRREWGSRRHGRTMIL